jgi:hypothetical protein
VSLFVVAFPSESGAGAGPFDLANPKKTVHLFPKVKQIKAKLAKQIPFCERFTD